MAITVAQFQAHLDAARTALGTGDYATAQREALQAQAVLAGIPDGQRAGSEVTWRETVEKLLAAIERLKREAASESVGMIQSTGVKYVAATG